jgi:hypothetical protein
MLPVVAFFKSSGAATLNVLKLGALGRNFVTDNQFEISKAMRDLSEQNVKQAHTAYGQLTNFVTQAMNAWMGAMPANPMAIGANNVQDHAMEFATLQMQFAQDCMQAFYAQTQLLSGLLQQAPQQSEQGAMGAPPSNALVTGFKEVQGRVVAMAKENAESASALAEKIAKAQNAQEILTLQTESVQEQMQAFAAQTQELYELIAETLRRSALR